MMILGYERIEKALRQHADSRNPMKAWLKLATAARWKSMTEVRLFYPHADAVGSCTVFNIKGNKYRLITAIDHGRQIISRSRNVP